MDAPTRRKPRPIVGGDDDEPPLERRPGKLTTDRALYEEIGRRLRFHREALGVTEEWMARRLGVSVPHYHRFETGERRIGLSDFMLAARALGQTASGLIEVSSVPGLPAERAPPPSRSPVELLRELERAMPVLLSEVAVDDLVGGVRRSAVAAALRPLRVWAYDRRPAEREDVLAAVRVGNDEGLPRLRIGEVAVLNLDALPGPGEVVLTSRGFWREMGTAGERIVMSRLAGPPVEPDERPIGVVRQAMRLV